MTNFERWHYYLKDLESPTHFITWNYYFMISSCLARRVWWGSSDFPVYPNLYIIIVGPPACGKSLPSNKMAEIVKDLKVVKVLKDGTPVESHLVSASSDSTTLESLYVDLVKATKSELTPDKKYYVHASMTFCITNELGTLFATNTNDLIRFLNQGYDCSKSFIRSTKNHGTDIISNICINLIGCCTIEFIKESISSRLINEGFTSRVIFLWGEKPRKRTTEIIISPEQQAELEIIKEHLHKVAMLYGNVKMTPDAYKLFDEWTQTKQDTPINSDPKLQHYYGRKKIHLVKLAMAIHFSDKLTMQIDKEDLEEALKILAIAELDMPNALNSKALNPIAELAEAILSQVQKTKKLTMVEILMNNFNGGNKQAISEALDYLVTTNQITSKPINGKTCYVPLLLDQIDTQAFTKTFTKTTSEGLGQI